MRQFIMLCGTAALGSLLVMAPALAQSPAVDAIDPFERLNRPVYAFNQTVEEVVLRPVAGAYRSLPDGVQAGVDNFFTNLREPVVTVASAMQGDGENTARSAGRFLVNSTAGIVGVFDVATPIGLISRPEDLGLTLCHYGIGEGPYLVLPFVGASSGRDAIGLAATYAATLGIAGGTTVPYLAADGLVSHAADGPATDADPSVDDYLQDREAYMETRAKACADQLEPYELKASPLGQVRLQTEMAELGPVAPEEPTSPPAEPAPSPDAQ